MRLRSLVVPPRNLNPMALERPALRPFRLIIPIIRRRDHILRQCRRMSYLLLTATTLLGEADGGGEDAAAPLTGLDGARSEGAAVAHALNVK